MAKIKLAIVYYSTYGSNYKLAGWAKNEAEALGAEVRLVKAQENAPRAIIDSQPAWSAHVEATKSIPVASVDDLDWADAIIFSAPVRFGGAASQIRHLIDQTGGLWFQGKLINKVVSAMTSAQNLHGGQEAALLNIYTSMMHWGAVIAAPGYSDPVIFEAGGCPYGVAVSVDNDGNFKEGNEAVEKAVKHQVKRTLDIAKKVVS